MKKILIGLLVFGSITSFASDKLNGPLDTEMFTNEVNENKSYYETLGEMFKNGSKPSSSKLLDVLWSGRCFYKETPYKPRNKAYHFRKKSNQDVGPLGNGVVSFEAIGVYRRNKSPNYFDSMNISKFNKKSAHLSYDKVFDLDNSFSIKYGDILSKLRFSGKYLVEEIFTTTSDVGPLSEGYEILRRCYYFIPEYAH